MTTNHPVMSMIKMLAPLQVTFKKLAKSGFNVVVRIQFVNRYVFSSCKRKYKAENADLSFGSRKLQQSYNLALGSFRPLYKSTMVERG